jgi:hypothetical protein
VQRTSAALLALAVVIASLLLAAPAESASPPWRGVLTFDKNWQNQFDSELTWTLYHRESDGRWKAVETRSWRAGAGLPGKVGRNSCATSKGWLPNGTYRLRQNDESGGRLIKGRAFRLDDKACPSGTVRHNLYVHTEQGPGNAQCRDRRGDQRCRWEFPRVNDYKSLGCIKMSPGDLAELVRLFQRHFSAGVRYATGQVSLRVVS